MEEGLEFGCGLEMLHTYSLIHDDMPCMDNDDLRRGKPTCHKQFGECVATLAGDALQAAAFRTVLSAPGPWSADPATPGKAALVMAEAAGELGMCDGQYWDTMGDGKAHTVEELTAIHNNKTGALLRASCMMGVLACSGRRDVSDSCLEAARTYATELGMAFQIQDDILDATATWEQLGKSVGTDKKRNKNTFLNFYTVEEARFYAEQLTREAVTAIKKYPDSDALVSLAEWLLVRDK